MTTTRALEMRLRNLDCEHDARAIEKGLESSVNARARRKTVSSMVQT